MKTSIILTSYIQAQYQAHLTMSCIANVTRYTDPDDYELIIVDAEPKFAIRDDYKCLKIDQHIVTDLGYTASMNLGASKTSYDILVFLQNDVFVYEGWLKNMRYYIEQDQADVVFPDQMPRSREFVLQSYAMSMEEGTKYGSRDAGCMMIRRSTFEATGGWNPNLGLLAERDMYERIGRVGRMKDTCKTMISHVMAGSNLFLQANNPEEYARRMKHDADLLNK